MKRIAIASAVSLVCLAILPQVIGFVNHSSSTPRPAIQQADGGPMPPPTPPWQASASLAA